jgi:hypothetical protein
MPKLSERQSLLNSLDDLILELILYDDDETAEFDELMELSYVVDNSRFLHDRTPIHQLFVMGLS